MSRILITGASGFIAGCLGRQLHRDGHDVVLGGRLATVASSSSCGLAVVPLDWADLRALQDACHGFDAIVHAAGVNAADCARNPVAALEFNAVASARLAAAAVAVGVRRIVYLSTAHVYASPLVGEISEATPLSNPHPYATSHRAGEDAFAYEAWQRRIEAVIVRLSNVFGAPTQASANCWHLLVNDLCRQAVETRRLVLRSSGRQQRDFVPIGEVCRILGVLTVGLEIQAKPLVANLGSGQGMEVIAMARLIQERCRRTLGLDPKLEHPQEDALVQTEPLFYRCPVLASSGVAIGADPAKEIDDLLTYCRETFGQNQ